LSEDYSKPSLDSPFLRKCTNNEFSYNAKTSSGVPGGLVNRPPLETAKKEVLTHDSNGNVTNADMAYKRAYALEVRGQFHDPLDEVEVAERFPTITFDSTFTQQEQAFLTSVMAATGHWNTGVDVHL